VVLETGNIVLDLQRWIEAYMREVENKNLSERTISIYSGILDEFVEYARQFQGEVGLEDVNRIFLNGFLTERAKSSKSFSPSTKRLHITVIKTFFLYITENNDSNADYEKMFRKMNIKVEEKVKPSLTDNDVTRLLNFLEMEKKGPRNRLINYRNSLLCKTMLYGGLRVHELMPFKLKDFILDEENEVYTLLVSGKGGKERYVYVPCAMIEDEVETLKEAYGVCWLICSTRNGTIINRSNLYQIVTGIFNRAGVDEKGLHILRHTFARRLVSDNTNLETIRDLLGHSNIAITAKFYAKTNEDNKRAAVAGMVKRKSPEKKEN
jgi:site-specific recombinase XerD